MKYRFFIFIIVFLGQVMGGSAQSSLPKLSLERLSSYLNSLKTLETSFVQYGPDGSETAGTIYMQRPGRMRLEYMPPNKNLIVVGGGSVAIFDEKSNQDPIIYPLKQTPLNIILAQDINLAAKGMVQQHYELDGTTRVLVQLAHQQAQGSVELVFSNEPLALIGWIVTDELGNQTHVRLGELELGHKIPSSLFDITIETSARKRK